MYLEEACQIIGQSVIDASDGVEFISGAPISE